MNTIANAARCLGRLCEEAHARGFARPTAILATRGVPPGSAVLLHKSPAEIRINHTDARRLFGDPMPVPVKFLDIPLRWAKA